MNQQIIDIFMHVVVCWGIAGFLVKPQNTKEITFTSRNPIIH